MELDPVDDPEILTGGNSNQVIRQGKTVLRKTGAWSPFVHALLRYLQANNFKSAPILLESSDTHERLSFLEGEVGNYPLKPFMQSEAIVIEAAQWLRQFHDLTDKFEIPANSQFSLPVDVTAPYEVICHNDFAPYNCVFKDNHLVGVIDFDTASPGTRLWDIAYAVYRFAPLVTDEHCFNMGWQSIPDRLGRLKLFCDAYGLENRSALIEMVIQRLEAMVRYMQDHAFNLDHIPTYQSDLSYLQNNQPILNRAL
jgi:thiamine kinase-like enzyme